MEKVEGYIFTGKEYKPYFDFWEALSTQDKNKFYFHERSVGAQTLPDRQTYTYVLGKNELETVTKLVGAQDAGMFLVFSSLLGLLFKKYSGESRVILDTPLYKASDQLKTYARKVPLVLDVRSAWSLKDYLEQCQERIKSTYKFQNFPLELIRNNRDQQQFQTNIAFTFDAFHQHFENVSVYDLVVQLNKVESGYNLIFDFTNRFSAAFIANAANHLRRLIGFLADLKVVLSGIDVVDDHERKTLLQDFGATSIELPAIPNLKHVFETKVATTPSSTALVSGNRKFTYEQLNIEANKVAHVIRSEFKVENNQVVGVIAGRNERMIIAILGILKAGAAFLPIDSTFPKARKELILADANVKLLLTESDFMFDLDQYRGEMMMLDIQLPELEAPTVDTDYHIDETDLAYVIYTSGSTGKPKGVMIEHRSAVNMALEQIRRFGVMSTDNVLQLASCSFDASISEIFKTFFSGATLVMVEQKVIKEPKSLFDFIRHHHVTIVTFPPSFLASVDLRELSGLRVIISAGEAAKLDTALECIKHVKYFNAYGPTECTVCVSIQDVNAYIKNHTESSVYSVPIGRPMANTTVYLLDDDHNLVPVGVPGEVCVSGVGLSRGYLNQDDLTAKSFVDNPFQPGTKMYKTGDLAKWLPGGELEYLGRKDHQVKIRGHRVELGEIQHAIENLPEVEQALVIALDDPDREKTLVAYFSGSKEVDISSLTEKLQHVLPAFMIPAHVIQVNDFPLNKQGKINRNLLPNPFQYSGKANYTPPQTEMERRMVEIWENVMGHQRIGIHDDFFALGGDSIKAIRLIGEINKQFRTDLEVKDIFNHADVEKLTAYFQRHGQKNNAAIQQATQQVEDLKRLILADADLSSQLPSDWEDFYPASDIQVGMLYHNLLDTEAGVFHDQMFHQIRDESFDHEIFCRALELLAGKHEILRTSFDFKNFSCSMQIVHAFSDSCMDVDYEDITHLQRASQKEYLKHYLKKDIRQPFNISKPGLWRIRVFKLTESDVGMLLAFHHAIIDGWSDNSFVTELSNVYQTLKGDRTFRPAPLMVSYKDYIIDQIRQQNATEVKKFWKRELENFNGVNLPFNRPAPPPGKKTQSINKTFFIQQTVAMQLARCARENIIPLKHILFAAFLYLIKRTTHANDVCVGIVTNGRPDKAESDRLLGCFLNTVPFIYSFKEDKSLHKFLHEVNERCIELKSYDKLSLPEILRLQGKGGGMSSHIVDVSFNYVDFYITKELSQEVKAMEPLVNGSGNNPAPFAFSIKKVNDNIRVNMVFLEGLYSEEEINRMATYYQNILSHVAQAKSVSLGKMNILGDVERNKLQHDIQGKSVNYPSHDLVTCFENMVSRSPDALAVISGNQKLTYRLLNERANKLASYLLRHFEIAPEDRIAICMDRNEHFIVSMLGVLKTGAGFISLTKDTPATRINAILEDAAVSTVLVQNTTLSAIEHASVTNLDTIGEELEQYGVENPGRPIGKDDLAYIIYTSGTTGTPKGVMLSHRNILNTIQDQIGEFSITANDRVIQLASPLFDVAMYETWMALCSGAALVMVAKEIVDEPQRFVQYLNQKQVSVMAVTPGYLNLLPRNDLSSLRVVITGGEAPKMKDVLQIANHSGYFNSFGPTECSVCISTYKFDVRRDTKKRSLPIGRPLSNTKVYVVDDSLQLTPQDVVGEMVVAGTGVARGYLNNPELTAEKFIDNPFETGTKLYRTGDLARWNRDGFLEFGGRNDSQLKVNGYRIEPGEIETLLLKHPQVKGALVTLRKTETNNMLVAYIASEQKEVGDLREFLSGKLPAYMIPGLMVFVPVFPLSENGKIDLEKLRGFEPVLYPADESLVAPANLLEKELLQLWQDVLGIERISTTSSFFEVGGSSLTLIRVYNKLSVKYKTLRIADLFSAPTIRALAAYLGKDGRVEKDNNVLVEGFNV